MGSKPFDFEPINTERFTSKITHSKNFLSKIIESLYEKDLARRVCGFASDGFGFKLCSSFSFFFGFDLLVVRFSFAFFSCLLLLIIVMNR